MAVEGRTLTQHFHIETRQHELFNLDLGEGVPRRMLIFGIIVVALWVGLLLLVAGTPTRNTFFFYMTPPLVLVYFGFKDSDTQPRRKRLTQWAIKGRYLSTGHRPIIGLGARASYRTEWVPMSDRLALDQVLRKVAPAWMRPEWEQGENADDGAGSIQVGRAIPLNQTANLYGFDYMDRLRNRRKKSRGRRAA